MIWRLASQWYTINITHTHYYIDVTGVLRRRNSPATQLFDQQLVLAIKNENETAPHYWPYVEGILATEEFPSQTASNAESVAVTISMMCEVSGIHSIGWEIAHIDDVGVILPPAINVTHGKRCSECRLGPPDFHHREWDYLVAVIKHRIMY